MDVLDSSRQLHNPFSLLKEITGSSPVSISMVNARSVRLHFTDILSYQHILVSDIICLM